MKKNINQLQNSYASTFTPQQSLNLSQPSSYNPSVLSLYTGRQIQQKFYEYLLLNRKKQTQLQSYNLSFHLENKFLELEKFKPSAFKKHEIQNIPGIENNIPPDMAAFANEMGQTTDTDFLSCVSATCACTAISMRGRFQVRLDNHWSEMVNLYYMIAKNAGERKSALVEFIKPPIKNFCLSKSQKIQEQHTTPSNVHPSQIVKIKIARERSIIADHIKNINANGEPHDSMTSLFKKISEMNKQMDPYIAKEYIREEIFWDVSTLLGLLKKLDKQGEAIALLEPEASLLLSKHFKEETLIPLLNKAYVGESYQYETANTKNVINLEKPSINMLLLLQTEIMVQFFSNQKHENIGILGRILPIFASNYVKPEFSCASRFLDEDMQTPSQIYASKMNKILEFTYTQDRNREIFTINCEKAAYDKIKNIEFNIKKIINQGRYPHMVSFMNKLHGHAVRIAGAIHGWNHARPHEIPITESEMQAGIDLAVYSFSHADLAFNTELRQTKKLAYKVLRYLLNQDWTHSSPIISASTLQAYVRGLNKNNCPATLQFLEDHNFIRQHHEPGYSTLCILHSELSQLNLDLFIDI